MASRGRNKVIIHGRDQTRPGSSIFTIRNSVQPDNSHVRTMAIKTGEQKELTEWHRVAVSGKLAEVVTVCEKGDLYFEGMLRTRKWKTSHQTVTQPRLSVKELMAWCKCLAALLTKQRLDLQPAGQPAAKQSSPAETNLRWIFDDDIHPITQLIPSKIFTHLIRRKSKELPAPLYGADDANQPRCSGNSVSEVLDKFRKKLRPR